MVSQPQQRRTLNTYNGGRPYTKPRGRCAPRETLEDHIAICHPVVTGRPTPEEFIQKIERELKIRCYGSKIIKTYRPITDRVAAQADWPGSRTDRRRNTDDCD